MKKNFNSIYSEIDSVNYSVLKRETLQVMYDKISKDQVNHLDEIKKLKSEIEACLRAHDGTAAIDLKVKARKIQKSYKDAEADKDKTVILAEANRKSEILRGEGESKAISIYANAFEMDPDFYSFYRSMQAYGNVLGEDGTTMILSPDSEFLEFFNDS